MIRSAFALVVAVALLAGCKQDAPPAQPTPAPVRTVAPVAKRPTPVPLPRWHYTPKPVIVPTPTPEPISGSSSSVALANGSAGAGIVTTPLDPPPVGNNSSSGSVTGNGSSAGITVSNTPAPTPTPTAVPSVTPSPTIATKHIQTIIYGQNSPASPSPYSLSSPGPWAQYVSYVWTPLFSWSKAMQTAGLKLIYYDNPMSPQDYSSTTGPCTASTSTVYDCTLLRSGGTYNSVAAKDSGGNIVTSYSGKGIAADPTATQFAAYWGADLSNSCAHMSSYGATYDLIFVDNNAGPLAGGFSATPTTWDATTWGNDFSYAAAHLGTLPSCFLNDQVISNSLGLGDSIQSTLINAYMNSTAVVGAEYEECFTNGYGWFSPEDSAILAVAYIKANSKPSNKAGWICYANNQTLDASANTRARMFVYGSYLLTYDPNYTSLEESFKTPPSNIQIFPETEFVPLGPSKTASNPIVSSQLCATTCTTSGYTVTNGVFVQYFTNGCYYNGTKVSDDCEVAVNPTGSTSWSTGAVTGGTPQTIPNPNGYAHQMTVTGYGTMDGGSVSFSSPSTTSLAPQSAEILVP